MSSTSSAVIRAKYVLAQRIYDPVSGRTLCHRRTRDCYYNPGGYSWRELKEDETLPRGVRICHAQTADERKAAEEGVLFVMVDVLTIPTVRRYFEHARNWQTFAMSKIDLYRETQKPMTERWAEESEDWENEFPSLPHGQDSQDEWDTEEEDARMEEWCNPAPVETFAEWSRAARGEGLGLDKIGQCGAWGDDDDW